MRSKIVVLTAILFSGNLCLADCPWADLNGDCIVNFLDFGIMTVEGRSLDLPAMASNWLDGAEDGPDPIPLGPLGPAKSKSSFLLRFVDIAKKRTTRIVFEYECRLALENISETTFENLELAMARYPRNIGIFDPHVSFGNVRIVPGQSATSIDTCTFEVDRGYWIDPAELSFSIVGVSEDIAFVPGGKFEMGDNLGEGEPGESPVHKVRLDSFYMGRHEISNLQYAAFLNAAMSDGSITVMGNTVYKASSGIQYPYCSTASSINSSHIAYNLGAGFVVTTKKGRQMLSDPAVEVSWCGAVAYCNWLSEKKGRSPCYDLTTWNCDFSKDGYRLPTEAEWEYAARGGLSGKRFAWGDTISHGQANYYSSSSYPYDVSATRGYHPLWRDGEYPYTSPVGSFATNGYGLYDMTGNVWEWCNDWYYRYYYGWNRIKNPLGRSRGYFRILRGGGAWFNRADDCRVANRNYDDPVSLFDGVGFRVVRPFYVRAAAPVEYEYVSIDDMESYELWINQDYNLWDVWIDGEGDCSGSGNGSGSTLIETSLSPVLGGVRSMEYYYDNDGNVTSTCTEGESPSHFYSKIVAQVADLPSGIGANWNLWPDTQLVINFYGNYHNKIEDVDPLWIELTDGAQNTAKVVYGDRDGEDPAWLRVRSWSEWLIDMTEFADQGIDTANVVSIAIGIGSEDATTPGATGKLFFDEIRLATATSTPRPKRLIGHWTFNEGSGTTAADSSGYDNAGVLVGDPVWTSVLDGHALRFEGANDAVQIGTQHFDPNMGTIALWARGDAFTRSAHYLFGHISPSQSSDRIQLYLEPYNDESNAYLQAGLGDSHTVATQIRQFNAMWWYHIGLTWNEGVYRVYVDGEVAATGQYQGLNALAASADIGNNGNLSLQDKNQSFSGVIDEVRIYDYMLSYDQILQIYNLHDPCVPDPCVPGKMVDDMEIYTSWSVPGNNIFEVWRDGEGNCQVGNGNGTGAYVTENLNRRYILGGDKSMEFIYDNDGLVFSACSFQEMPRPYLYSKAEAQIVNLASGIDPNWMPSAQTRLVLNFYGQADNEVEPVDPLWVELRDSKGNRAKTVYGTSPGESPQHLTKTSWHRWVIDMNEFADDGVDTTHIASIAVGVGKVNTIYAGGSGTLYFDEIHLETPQ